MCALPAWVNLPVGKKEATNLSADRPKVAGRLNTHPQGDLRGVLWLKTPDWLHRGPAMPYLPRIYTVHHEAPPAVIDNPILKHFLVGDVDATPPVLCDRYANGLRDRKSYAETRVIDYAYRRGAFATHIGIQHYRRVFLLPEITTTEEQQITFTPGLANVPVSVDQFNTYNRTLEAFALQHPDQLSDWFEQYDAIVPPVTPVPTIQSQYQGCHKTADWDIFMRIAAKHGVKLFPESGDLRACNCFILRRPLFEAYAEVWRAVMDELWGILPIDADGYQHRTIGFLSERLFTFWFMSQPGLTTRELPLLITT